MAPIPALFAIPVVFAPHFFLGEGQSIGGSGDSTAGEMNASRFLVLPFALTVLIAPFSWGCIIVDGGDDGMNDDAANDGATDTMDDGATTGNDTNETNDSVDESGSAGNGDGPTEGLWVYTETGITTNDCAFLEEPTNGWGEFTVESISGGFRVTPGDTTDAFDCTAGDGAFSCPERLADEFTEGTSSLQVLVTVTGTLDGDDSMSGTQDGSIVCEGADCALAEQLLDTSFPCAFSIEFDGTAV